MKHANKSEPSGESPKKKLKKSVSISSEVEVQNFTNENPKNSKIKKKAKNMDKKSKFEKSTNSPKLTKPLKVKDSAQSFSKEQTQTKKVKKINPDKLNPKKAKFTTEIKEISKQSSKLQKVQKISDKFNKKSQVLQKSGKYVHQNTENGEKPDWKKLRKEQKEMKTKRKEQKFQSLYSIFTEAKKISEKVRCENCPEDERHKLCQKLHELLKTHYHKLVFTHDLSRVVQWLIKYCCDAEIRRDVMMELKPLWQEMFFTKYANKCIKAGCEYGTDDIRHQVLDSCYGNVVKILSTGISSPLFEKIYAQYATLKHKTNMKQEFYGDIYKGAKDPDVKILSDVFKDAQNMKTPTLNAVKGILTKILNKKLIGSTIVHTVLYEYLSNCSASDRSEMIQMVRDMIVQLIETKSGSKAGVICIWHGTNKDRKVMMKSLKEHLKDVFMSENGHLMLMALIDCVDDTVLMKKILLTEMEKDLKEIAQDEFGRKVLLYLVARRDSKFFHPVEVSYFTKGDGNASSKKPTEIREKELLDHVIDGFLKNIAEDTLFWLSNGSVQMITSAILRANHNRDLKPVFEAIANFVMDKEITLKEEDGKEVSVVEHAGLHMMLKKMLQSDKLFQEKNKSSLADVMVKKLDDQVVRRWVDCNRGCFLLVFIAENGSKEVLEKLKEKLSGAHDDLKKKSIKGASILLKKII